MEILLTHVAGVDVHKDQITVTTIIGGNKIKTESWVCKTFTEDLRECGQKLLDLGIKHVAMESTGVYWKAVFNVWNEMGILITLANAHHVKNVPGRKTDMKDSFWLAKIHRSGLIRKSFIPEPEYQKLRLLTRHRIHLSEDITRVKNRIQRTLEDGNVKLGSVLSNIFGASGLPIVRKLAEGQNSLDEFLEYIHPNVRAGKEDIRKALSHCLNEEHLFLLTELLFQYDALKELADNLDKRIDEKMIRFSGFIEQLDAIPGIDKKTAQVIIAEATTQMDSFDNDRSFAAWAGVAPGNNESASKKKKLEREKEMFILKLH